MSEDTIPAEFFEHIDTVNQAAGQYGYRQISANTELDTCGRDTTKRWKKGLS